MPVKVGEASGAAPETSATARVTLPVRPATLVTSLGLPSTLSQVVPSKITQSPTIQALVPSNAVLPATATL